MCAMAAGSELALGGLLQEGRKRGVCSILQRSCEREKERMLQLMMGPVDRPPTAPLVLQDLAQSMQKVSTLDLALGTSKGPPSLFDVQSSGDMCSSSSPSLELDSHSTLPLPSGWEKCLDLQTGSIYYLNRSTGLSTSCDPRMKPPSTHLNWAPTSPSSSSDLTFEGVPPSSASKHPATSTNAREGSSAAAEDFLDLSLSLGPCSNSVNKRARLPAKQSHSLTSQAISRGSKSIMKNSSTNHHVGSIFKQRTAMAGTSVASVSTSSNSEWEDVLGSLGSSSRMGAQQSEVLAPAYSSAAAAGRGFMSMMTVGCGNCLMFVMLPHSRQPKCPRCGAPIDTTELPQPGPSKRAKLGLYLFS